MLLLRVIDSRGAVTQHFAERFPYRIGRSAQADLRIEAAGVWESHAAILPGENARFLIRSEGESLLLRNGEPVQTAQLASGDELSIGAARVIVSLAPARQKSLVASEAIVWAFILAVAAVEAAAFLVAG
jgi:hypothetical protein